VRDGGREGGREGGGEGDTSDKEKRREESLALPCALPSGASVGWERRVGPRLSVSASTLSCRTFTLALLAGQSKCRRSQSECEAGVE
jgi:hypothetical protein